MAIAIAKDMRRMTVQKVVAEFVTDAEGLEAFVADVRCVQDSEVVPGADKPS